MKVSNLICILQMTGKDMCALSKEEFCARAPVFVGDILWEHLVLLQKDVDRKSAALKNAPSNLSETSTEPTAQLSVYKPEKYLRFSQKYLIHIKHSILHSLCYIFKKFKMCRKVIVHVHQSSIIKCLKSSRKLNHETSTIII